MKYEINVLGRPQFALAFAAAVAVAVVFLHPAVNLPAASAGKGSPSSLFLHLVVAMVATLLPIVLSAAVRPVHVLAVTADPLDCEERLALICSRIC